MLGNYGFHLNLSLLRTLIIMYNTSALGAVFGFLLQLPFQISQNSAEKLYQSVLSTHFIKLR